MPSMALLSSAPDSIAEIGAGLSLCASGSHVCIGRDRPWSRSRRAPASKPARPMRDSFWAPPRARRPRSCRRSARARNCRTSRTARCRAGEADPGGNDDDVLPGRFDAFGRPLKSDQERADQRGQFDRDPVETGIVHDRAQQDRQGEAGKERIEAPKPCRLRRAGACSRSSKSKRASKRSRCKASPMRRSCRRRCIRRDNGKARWRSTPSAGSRPRIRRDWQRD